MRTFLRLTFALALTVALAAPALAQRQPGGAGQGQGGIGQLLTNESVQKELKVEKEQADKLKDAVTKVTDAHKDEMAKLRDLQGEERRTKTQEMTKMVSAETLKAVGDILKPEQLKRLKQIELQQAGAQAYSRPDVVKTLGIKDEQKDKIKGIADDTQKQVADVRGGTGTAAEKGEMQTKIRKEAAEKVTAVLTDDQKKMWKEMTGEPFTIVRTRPNPNP